MLTKFVKTIMKVRIFLIFNKIQSYSFKITEHLREKYFILFLILNKYKLR